MLAQVEPGLPVEVVAGLGVVAERIGGGPEIVARSPSRRIGLSTGSFRTCRSGQRRCLAGRRRIRSPSARVVRATKPSGAKTLSRCPRLRGKVAQVVAYLPSAQPERTRGRRARRVHLDDGLAAVVQVVSRRPSQPTLKRAARPPDTLPSWPTRSRSPGSRDRNSGCCRRRKSDFRCRQTNIRSTSTDCPPAGRSSTAEDSELNGIVVELTEVRFPAEWNPKVDETIVVLDVGIEEAVRRSFESYPKVRTALAGRCRLRS